jgi:hypothetical protein
VNGVVVLRKYTQENQITGWAADKTMQFRFTKSGDYEVKAGDILEGEIIEEFPGPFRLVVQ